MKHQSTIRILAKGLAMGSLLIGLGIPTPVVLPAVAQRFSVQDEAIRLNPHDPEAWFIRGNVNRLRGQYTGAIVDYTEAIRLDPNNANVFAYYNNRGVANYNLGNYREAIEDYNQAIRLVPNLASAYYHRGLASLRAGDQQSALIDFEQATRLDPSLQNRDKYKNLLPLW